MTGVDGTTGTTATTGGTIGGIGTPSSDEFLRLLITQLEHQDPLNPLDDRDFTAQLAQFSSLEQLKEIRNALLDLGGIQQGLVNAQVLNLLGRTAVVSGVNEIHLAGGNADGIVVDVSTGAETVDVVVTDSAGQVVRTLGAPATAGRHEIAWDGKDDQGNALADGAYKVEVRAKDVAGNSLDATLYLALVVDGVSFDAAGTRISSAGRDVPFDRILEIRTHSL